MRSIIFTIVFIFSVFYSYSQNEADLGWPREVEKKGFTVVFYQPQLESFKENILEGRMAIALKRQGNEPVFGAAWYQTRVETDLDTHRVFFKDLFFTDTRFPDIPEENQKALNEMLIREIDKMQLEMSLDRFLVSLDGIKNQQMDEEQSIFDNTPPVIHYRRNPAVLVLIDGEPILKPTGESNLTYMINTPYFLVHDAKKDKYYLNGGSWWYESDDYGSGWTQIKKPPANVKRYNEELKGRETSSLDSDAGKLKDPPEIIVSTKPAELIISNGDPEFTPIGDTGLSYMSNSENDIIVHNSSRVYYILISGRWFWSNALDNSNWTFVNPYNLPEDFQNIPADSPVAGVKASVPGTRESREAILGNSIPQTAEIDRRTATTVVKYDGEPKFERIKKTDVYYAVNTDKSVLMINKNYYCVDNGIWYLAPGPKGPWRVCDKVPEAIYDIPPSSPVYNVRYVYIYDSTPDFVYVGYTPGYYGSYISYGTVIYGTGYRYSSWYGGYYYPRHVTYGYGVHYNPYTGWGYSVGLSYGWIYYNEYPYYWGYWGPAGYRYGYRNGYNAGYYHGYRSAYSANSRVGYTRTYRGGQTSTYSNSNIYRNQSTGVRSTGGTSGTNVGTGNRTATTVPRRSTQPNNVYSDPSGNIYRRQDNGTWQQRNNSSGQWQMRSGQSAPTQGVRPGSTPSGTQNRTTQQPNLNQYYNSRNRGATRSGNYNQSIPRQGSGTTPRQGTGTTRPGNNRRN